MHTVNLRFVPDITELTGAQVEDNIRRLGQFERNFAGLVKEGHSSFLASTLIDVGEGPGGLCDFAHPTCNKFKATGEAVRVANEFRGFCFEQFALVERALHGKLLSVWDALTPDERAQLRFHCIMTVNRSTVSNLKSAHADSFDGTICYFAVMSSNKVGTNIYPAAQVAWRDAKRTQTTTPQAQFLEEMEVKNARAPALRYNDDELGAERGWRSGSCVVLAPSVCHQIAKHQATDPTVDDATVGLDGSVLATATDPRWFCRVTLEITPAGEKAQKVHGIDNPFSLHSKDDWPSGLRSKVCMLVKEHCWGRLPLE